MYRDSFNHSDNAPILNKILDVNLTLHVFYLSLFLMPYSCFRTSQSKLNARAFLMRYTYSSLHCVCSHANPNHCTDQHKKKNPSGSEGCRQRIFLLSCGDEGIRTLDRVSPIHTFQACSFNHSDTSPFLLIIQKLVFTTHTFSRCIGTPSTTRTTLHFLMDGKNTVSGFISRIFFRHWQWLLLQPPKLVCFLAGPAFQPHILNSCFRFAFP